MDKPNDPDRTNSGHSRLASVEFGPAPAGTDAPLCLLGDSALARKVRANAESTAKESVAVVVIHGEAGSGKLQIARWLHAHGRRADRDAPTLQCGREDTLKKLGEIRTRLTSGDAPGNVIVAELDRASALEVESLLGVLADQGVSLRCGLLITACGDLSALRARSLPFDRLLGRAGSGSLHVPPLRARSEDIPDLARALLADAAASLGRNIRGISPQAVSRLQRHEFPGNLRELAMMIELAAMRCRGDWITAESFASVTGAVEERTETSEIVIRLPGSSLREIELQALRLALQLTGGRVVRAAELLGITRHALRRKLEKYGLSEMRFRHGSSTPSSGDEDNFI